MVLCEIVGTFLQQKLPVFLCLHKGSRQKAFICNSDAMNKGVKQLVHAMFLAKFEVTNYFAFQVALEILLLS